VHITGDGPEAAGQGFARDLARLGRGARRRDWRRALLGVLCTDGRKW